MSNKINTAMLVNHAVRAGFEERGERTGRIRANGTLPFSPIYGMGLHDDWLTWKDEKRRRTWRMERLITPGHWGHTNEGRGFTFNEAVNYCKGQGDLYRVAVLVPESHSTYRPYKAPRGT